MLTTFLPTLHHRFLYSGGFSWIIKNCWQPHFLSARWGLCHLCRRRSFQVTFLEKVTQRSSVRTRQTQEKKTTRKTQVHSVSTPQIFLAVCGVSGRGRPTQEWESTCSYQAFRHTTLVAKIHRSLYIKFLQLTWHTAVNQSMKGKLICCSLSLSLSLRVSLSYFSTILMSSWPKKKASTVLHLSASRSPRVELLNALPFCLFNGFVFGPLDNGWIPSLTDAFILFFFFPSTYNYIETIQTEMCFC